MRQALGSVEVKSLVGAIQAADTMLKSADVHIVDLNIVGSGIVSAIVTGEVAAVSAAVANAEEAAKQIGQIIATDVIPRPHEEVEKLLDVLI